MATVEPNQKYGRLTVVSFHEMRKSIRCWKCVCACKKETVVQQGNLRNGHTRSCGCLQSELTSQRSLTHGVTGTKIWRTWRNMHSRCENTKVKCYINYGGRGIKVCKEWFKFETFHKYMFTTMEAHIKKHGKLNTSIDRINNNQGYSLQNCKWSTKSEQALNRRNKYEKRK